MKTRLDDFRVPPQITFAYCDCGHPFLVRWAWHRGYGEWRPRLDDDHGRDHTECPRCGTNLGRLRHHITSLGRRDDTEGCALTLFVVALLIIVAIAAFSG